LVYGRKQQRHASLSIRIHENYHDHKKHPTGYHQERRRYIRNLSRSWRSRFENERQDRIRKQQPDTEECGQSGALDLELPYNKNVCRDATTSEEWPASRI